MAFSFVWKVLNQYNKVAFISTPPKRKEKEEKVVSSHFVK